MGRSKQLATLIDSAPATLDTLNELASALGDDANFSTTVTDSIATKSPLATPQFTNRVGIGVAAHGSAALNVTSTAQHMRLNNGAELGIISLESGGALNLWSHGDASNNEIKFYQGSGAGSESMRIDSNGKLLVGKTASNYATTGVEIRSNEILITKAGANPLSVRNNGNGGLISLNSAGTTIGTIGVESGNNLIVGGTVADHSGLLFGTNAIIPMQAGSGSDATQDLGNSGSRFKDAYLSGGIHLGGTGAANQLEDYEEGSFTPVLTWYTPSNGSVSYIARTATYVKVGRKVTIHLELRLNIVAQNSATPPLLISGFPFNFHNTGGYGGSLMQVSLSGFVFSSGHVPFGYGEYNSDRMFLYTMSNNAALSNLATPGNYKSINVSGTYITPV